MQAAKSDGDHDKYLVWLWELYRPEIVHADQWAEPLLPSFYGTCTQIVLAWTLVAVQLTDLRSKWCRAGCSSALFFFLGKDAKSDPAPVRFGSSLDLSDSWTMTLRPRLKSTEEGSRSTTCGASRRGLVRHQDSVRKPGPYSFRGSWILCLLAALEGTHRLCVHLGGQHLGCQIGSR